MLVIVRRKGSRKYPVSCSTQYNFVLFLLQKIPLQIDFPKIIKRIKDRYMYIKCVFMIKTTKSVNFIHRIFYALVCIKMT